MKLCLVLSAFLVVGLAADDIDWSVVKPAWEQPQYAEIVQKLNLNASSGQTSRIWNGWEAAPHQFPHMVLNIFTTNDGNYLCGASLISQRYVLTAAHCAQNANSFQFIFGAHNREIYESSQVRVTVSGSNKIIHPNWTPSNLHHDIAMVRLNNAIGLNSYIQVVQLPRWSQADNSFEGWWGIISGWGGTENGNLPAILRYVSNAILSNSVCSQSLNVWPELICISAQWDRGTCGGDSGSPMVISDGGYRQVGVHSFGVNGCGSSFPKGSARVASYLNWIRSNSDAVINN